MAGVDEVLERLITDLGFRRWLREDPSAALQGYDLDEADLELLASQRDDSGGQAHGVEQRTSKSALFGLLAGSMPSAGPPGGDFQYDLIGNRTSSMSEAGQGASDAAVQPRQSDSEFLRQPMQPSSDDAMSGPASEAEGNEPTVDAPLREPAARGKDTAPEGHSDWIPLQAVGGEESAREAALEDVGAAKDVDGEVQPRLGVHGSEKAQAISRTNPDVFDPDQAD